MSELLTTNCFLATSEMIIMGSCLKTMQPKAYEQLKEMSNNIFEVCLEKDHINMVITKLAGMLVRKDIKTLIFASVDKSPHCITLHYIAGELLKITRQKDIIIKHYVAVEDKLKEISTTAVKLSKNLSELQDLIESK